MSATDLTVINAVQKTNERNKLIESGTVCSKERLLVFWNMISNDLEINMPIKRKSKANKIHVNFTLNVAFRHFLKIYTRQMHVNNTRIGITTR